MISGAKLCESEDPSAYVEPMLRAIEAAIPLLRREG